MLEDNPYQTSIVSELPQRESRFPVLLWWLLFLQPAIAFTFIYLTWAITAFSLGRPPKFGEVPIHGILETTAGIIGTLAGLLWLAGLFLVPIGLVMAAARPFGRSVSTRPLLNRGICVGTYCLMLFVMTTLFLYDPVRVMYWFWD